MELKSFKINKLHDSLNFELKFENNTLILLGENGSCKTTIIKMLYYTLSLQWEKLSQYNFESVELFIDDDSLRINKKDILGTINERDLRRLPPPIRHGVMSMIGNEGGVDFQKIEDLCRQYDFPIGAIMQELSIDEHPTLFSEFGQSKNKQKLRKTLIESKQSLRKKTENIHVLYLPTYRRIEQDLKVVLDGRIDEDDFMRNRRIMRFQENNNYTELIEFGMRDVDAAIDKTLTYLKDSSRSSLNELTLGYLGDIIDEKYKSTDTKKISNIDDDTIHQIMNRVDDTILSKERKDKLFNTLQDIKNQGKIRYEHDKVVCHYFLKLYESQLELNKKETSIREFVTVCNRYLENKTMYYDGTTFESVITSNYDGHDIKLFQLSSGEKQIVSLFSHLYLSNKNNYLVLIDEPELSLSVKWQKTFLEDVRKGAFCKGIVAVTHSPFIFDNCLDEYAHGIEEFRR